MRAQFPTSGLILGYEATAYAALHRRQDAEDRLSRITISGSQTIGEWMRITAAEFGVHDQPVVARAMRAQAVDWFIVQGNIAAQPFVVRLQFAEALFDAGRFQEARREFLTLSTEHAGQTDMTTVRGSLGVIACHLGNLAETASADRWLSELPTRYPRGYPFVWRARIALASHDTARALALLKVAVSSAFPKDDGEQFYDPLHRIEELQPLLRRLGGAKGTTGGG